MCNRMKLSDSSRLLQQVIRGFCPRFIPGGIVIFARSNTGKMCNLRPEYRSILSDAMSFLAKRMVVLIHDPRRQSLFIMEIGNNAYYASSKRLVKFEKRFTRHSLKTIVVKVVATRAQLSGFLARCQCLRRYNVWIAGDPEHMIFFNRDYLFGPYPC